MPAAAPPRGPQLKKALRQLGQQIQLRRKLLKVSAVAAAEASGVSRMTLNRIESGEASVTFGAYLNVISVLGLTVELSDPKNRPKPARDREDLDRIRLADYPQLKQLAWQLKDTTELSAEEALELYERNWRHVEKKKLTARERALIKALLARLARAGLLV